MTTVRRTITMPLMAILMVVVLAVGPVLLLGSGAVGLAMRTSRPPRTVALTMAYALIELRAMMQVLRGNRDCDQMVHDFLVSAHAAVRRILDVLQSGRGVIIFPEGTRTRDGRLQPARAGIGLLVLKSAGPVWSWTMPRGTSLPLFLP